MPISMNSLCVMCRLRKDLDTARSVGDEATATQFAKAHMQMFLDMPEGVDSAYFGARLEELFQKYFDSQDGYPSLYDPTEYSFYFEKCYDNDLARQRFIEQSVVRHNPSIGYLCLAEMIIHGRIKNIWTTNFDSLPETAINILEPQQELLVCSSVNSDSIDNFNPNYPCICKLHGDSRYGKLQNTSEELQKIEYKLQEYWLQCLHNRGMVVLGYSGNDESVMNFLEQHIADSTFLSKGLFWMTIRGVPVNAKVEKLIEKAKQHNKIAEIIEFDSFDDFFQNLYKSLGYKNSVIDEQWKNKINKNICFNKRGAGHVHELCVQLYAYACPGRGEV